MPALLHVSNRVSVSVTFQLIPFEWWYVHRVQCFVTRYHPYEVLYPVRAVRVSVTSPQSRATVVADE